MQPSERHYTPRSGQHTELLKVLKSLRQDFKASVVAAEISSTTLKADTIHFRNQSTFKRQVSTDIADISWNTAENFSDQLIFDLNREGIYDMLPEAIAHTQAQDKRNSEGNTRRGAELRQQEREARLFFSPIENEFAHRSLMLDIIEREILSNDNPVRTRQFFEYFFGDSAILTHEQVTILGYILPLCHKIRGNTLLISLAISKILGYPAEVMLQHTPQTFKRPQSSLSLSENILGVDSILNDSYTISAPHYTIIIREVDTIDFADFSGSGKHANVINFVAAYFFPAGAAITVKPECNAGQRDFVLATAEDTSFLDFNSYI